MMEFDEDLEKFKSLCSEKTLQKEAQGFFFGLVHKVRPCVNIETLSSLRTDLEKVKYCTSTFWDLIGAELVFKTKSPEDAAEKRLEGNDAFVKGDLKKALRLYCQAVIRAPAGVDLAMVLSNRSSLFLKMGETQFALEDAELAIANDYPVDKRHKLYERMAACYVSLEKWQDVKRTVHLAKHLGEKNEEKDEKFWAKLQKLQLIIKQGPKNTVALVKKSSDVQNIADQFSHLTISEPSKKFGNASAKFDVHYEPGQGRFAVATKEIAPCELVLKEEAYAAILMPERLGTHCLNCLKRIKAAFACETCANVAFCSRECKKQGEKYHRYECKILTLLIGSGMSELSHLALRIITQSSLPEFKEKVKGLQPDASRLLLTDGKFNRESYENVYNLCAIEDQRSPEDFFHRCVMTVFLMKCLRLVGYFDINLFKQRYPNEDELFIGSIILRNLQVLQFNAYEITELVMKNKSSLTESKGVNLGLGIYNTAAMLNHSCAPNVYRFFQGSTIFVQTLESVAKGTSLWDNYGPSFTNFSTKDRQRNLAGRYWFVCKCPPCVEDWPDLQALTELRDLKGNDKALNQAAAKVDSIIQSFFAKGMDALQRGNTLVATEYFKKFLEEFYKLRKSVDNAKIANAMKRSSFQFSKTFYLAQDALKLLLSANGNHFCIE